MDNLRRFPGPWVMKEDRDGFRIFDASGSFICAVPHSEDLHQGSYQYAYDFLSREEARRIAKAISSLPALVKRPQY